MTMKLLTDRPAGHRKESSLGTRPQERSGWECVERFTTCKFSSFHQENINSFHFRCASVWIQIDCKGLEDAIVHRNDNDDAMSRLCNPPLGCTRKYNQKTINHEHNRKFPVGDSESESSTNAAKKSDRWKKDDGVAACRPREKKLAKSHFKAFRNARNFTV